MVSCQIIRFTFRVSFYISPVFVKHTINLVFYWTFKGIFYQNDGS